MITHESVAELWWCNMQFEASPIFSGHVRVNQGPDFFGRGPIFFPDIDRGTSGGDFVNYAEPMTQVFRCF